MTKRREFKDGDIYFWRYKNPDNDFGCGPYHCKSCKAIVSNGVLYDTFWSDHSHSVPIKDVKLTFKGNINFLDEIPHYDIEYYRYDDIVDMRHSNSSASKIYVKGGTKRDPDTMLAHAKYQLEQFKSKIKSANWSIDDLNASIDLINAGDLDKINIPVCR